MNGFRFALGVVMIAFAVGTAVAELRLPRPAAPTQAKPRSGRRVFRLALAAVFVLNGVLQIAAALDG